MNEPMIGIIGGTGLGDVLANEASRELHDISTPFGKPSAPLMTWEWNGVRIAFIPRHGIGHVIPPPSVPFRANIFALKTLGVTHVLASGAVGSLREHIEPRHLVVPDQIIDKTHRRAGTFFDEGLAAHVELAHPFCQGLRERILALDDKVETTVHTGGTYICMEGPQFSTIAESEMHRAWGGDLIGMTVMPEAKLAREAEMCYALVALATDYDCWRPHDPNVDRQALLEEILSHLRAATDHAVQLLRATVADLAERPPGPCDCHEALKLAIWSNKGNVSPAIVKKLRPIIGRYFADMS